MNYETALKVVKLESDEQTAERIVELYETIGKLSGDCEIKICVNCLNYKKCKKRTHGSDLKCNSYEE